MQHEQPVEDNIMTDIINEENLYAPKLAIDSLLLKTHEELAYIFAELIFPRLINQVTEDTQLMIDSMKRMKAQAKKDSNPTLEKELDTAQKRLKKMLSEDTLEKVMGVMADHLKEALSPDELAYAIYQERITIKLAGVASSFPTVFNVALERANTEEEK